MMANFDYDEKKFYEELYSLIGAKIRFKCDGCVQEGEILTIKPIGRRVILKNVYFVLPNQRIFSGTLKYRFSDLTNYEVVATAKELNPYPKFEYLSKILQGDNVSKKYSLNDLFYDGNLSESEDEEFGVEDAEKKDEEFDLEVPKNLEGKLPRDIVLVDCYDLEWKQAIKHIGNQKKIGLSFHGNEVSRLGKLSWMCVCTSWCVFLFDIQKLGTEAFDNGLRSILEDSGIVKVIHDCRFPSDCLAHQFDTKLVNVFDTLVADFVVSMQCYNDKHKYEYVQSLNSCLRIYLEIPPEFTYSQDRYKKKEAGNDFYSQRPVSNAHKHILVKDTIYLLLLQDVMAKKLLGPLHRNVDRYLKVIAGATKQELDTVGDEISSPDCIPPSVLMYGIQTVQFRNVQSKEPASLKCNFVHPVTGEVIDVKKHSSSNEVKSLSEISSNSLGLEKYKKENSSYAVMNGKQRVLPVLRDNRNCAQKSVEHNKKSVIVEKIIARPSVRHVDEVYHKLVNSAHFRSQNSGGVINVKPAANYESKFTMRVPLECAPFSDHASDDCVVTDTDSVKTRGSSSSTASSSSDDEDIWSKLRAAFSDSSTVSRNAENRPPAFKFVPAGMSC